MDRILITIALASCVLPAQERPFNFASTNTPSAFASGGYGAEVAGMGDVDGDGFEDYAVVAPGAAMPLGGPDPFGVIYVHSGRDAKLLTTMLGDQLGGMFGHAMTSPGDVDGDAVPDLCVGSPSHDGGFGNSGRVTMFAGADGSVLWTSNGDGQGLERGSCLATMPDITGDGVPDVLAGEPGFGVGGAGRGRCVFLNGATGAFVGEAIGPIAFTSFGSTAVGSPTLHAVFVGDGVGRTYRVPAPIAGQATPVLFRDRPPGSHVAVNLALLPQSGGGVRIAIALPTADITGANSGALWLHEGSGPELFEHSGPATALSLGGAVCRGRDLDGDGEDEVVVTRGQSGLQPAVVEILRQDGTLIDQFATDCAGTPALASLGDTTGDARGELLVSYSSGLCGLAETWLFARGLAVGIATAAGATTATTQLDFGPSRASQSYWQWFSISGTEPGFAGPSPWPLVPLNVDGITFTIDGLSGSVFAPNIAGNLDAAGRATTTLTIPAVVAPLFSGISFATVGLVLDGAGQNLVATSNPGAWTMP